MAEELKRLAKQSISFSETEWEALSSILKPKQLNKHEHFLRQGEICNRMGFIVKGYVRLYFISHNENDISKDFCFESDFCGSYASFISGTPSRFNVLAMEDTLIYTMSRSALTELAEQYPCWQKFIRLKVEELFVRKENREASFLLDGIEDRYNQLSKEIIQRVPLKYIASYLGTTPETISRIRGKRKI